MSRDDMELLFNNVLLVCQLCLGLWQFCKLTPVGALIQGAFGWLLRPMGLSPVYSRLQHCGRVFKKANCFALEPDFLEADISRFDIPHERGDIESCEVNTMELPYLGKTYVLKYVLKRKGEDSNMLYINDKMCYYITHRIWKKLQNLQQVLRYGLEGPPLARAVVTKAAANRAEAHADRAEDDARSAKHNAERAESMAAEAERTEAERVKAEAEAELAEAEHGKAKAVAKRAEAEAERTKAEHEKAKAEAEAAETEAKLADAELRKAEAKANRAKAVAEAELAKAEADLAQAERAKAEHEKAKAEIDWAQGDEAKLADAERRKADAKANLAKAVAEAELAKAEAELAQAERAKARAERANAECLKAAVEPGRSKAAQAEAVLEAEAWAEVLAEAEARAKAKAEVKTRIMALAKDSKIEAFALNAKAEAMARLAEAESKAKAGAEAKAKSKSKAAQAEFAVSIARSAATRADKAMRAAKTYRAAADNVSLAARAATNSAALAAAARDRIPALTTAAADARAKAFAARSAATERTATDTADTTLFVKGKKEFWKQVITGGVMTFKEVSDAIILYNQHVSRRLSNDWLLPVNLSVSEEKLLKIFNLVALFLQTKKANVHWLIPTALSLISALLEFSTRLRLWFYTKINELFCNIMHFICDPLPRSWRRQVYCLGKWVENLAPSNDLLVKVVRGNMCAIISEGAKVQTEGAILVPWLETELTPDYGVIEKQFRCNRIDIMIRCSYVIDHQLCEIFAPPICVFYVKCKTPEDFRRIVTLVSCIAENCCGSLICYGPNNKVCIRGFEESVTSYVNNELPPIYKLKLMNVVVAGRDASD